METGWLETIGTGAFKRKNELLTIFGGLWALVQNQSYSVRIAGRSALEYQGFGHNISFESRALILFTSRGQTLPQWFKQTKWDFTFLEIKTNCFDICDMQLITHKQTINGCAVIMSTPELAILEACYLAPQYQDLEELGHFMESLTSLRPNVLQHCLESCTSIKTKRLFLFLARKYQHAWFSYIDEQKIDLGQGKRYIVKGKLDKYYQITLPKEWFHDSQTLF